MTPRRHPPATGYRQSVDIGKQPWPTVDRNATLLIPLGSTEQHGPHLPLDTDARIAEAVALRAAEALEQPVAVAPVVAYGASGEHAGFAGTLSIGTDVLRSVLIELVRSAALTFERIVFVNGHGGNIEALRAAVTQMRAEGHAVSAWSPTIPDGDAHAGRTETALMLAIAPETVRLELAEAGNTTPIGELIDELRAGGVVSASPNGVLGDPRGANAAEGETLLEMLTSQLAKSLVAAA